MSPRRSEIKITPYSRKVGDRLEEIRKNGNYTDSEMAAFMGTVLWTYRSYRRGAHIPASRTLYQLSKNLKISLDWLLMGRGSMYYTTAEEKPAPESVQVEKNQESVQGQPMSFNGEMEEMAFIMQHVPLIRHSMMAHFQELKKNNRDFIVNRLDKIDPTVKDRFDL